MSSIRQSSILSILAVLFLLGPCRPISAQNFVPNPSFETHTGCPTSPGVFSIVGNWFLPPSHSGSPDYHHVCGNSTFGVPVNIFGSQLARTGQGYIGFVTHFGSGNFREYLQVQLTSPLTAGTSYTATAYLTLSDGSGWATDGFGFYFSNTIVSGSGSSTPLPLIPQVSNPVGNYINSWVNWLPVTGSFVATAGMQYMTIGNFKNDASTGVQVQASGWGWNYTYADDFSVTPTVILSAELGEFTGEVQQEAAVLTWDTRSEQGTQSFEVERSLGDLQHFERVGTVTAAGGPSTPAMYRFTDVQFKATQLNYYRIKEIDQNGGGGYTSTIELHTDALLNEIALKAYPSPLVAGHDLQLEISSTRAQTAQIDLIDVQGRTVRAFETDLAVGANPIQMPTDQLVAGCYVLRLIANGVVATQKVMVAASN